MLRQGAAMTQRVRVLTIAAAVPCGAGLLNRVKFDLHEGLTRETTRRASLRPGPVRRALFEKGRHPFAEIVARVAAHDQIVALRPAAGDGDPA